MENKKCNVLLEKNRDCLHCKYIEELNRAKEYQINFLVHYWSHNLNFDDKSINKYEQYAKFLLDGVKADFFKTELQLSILAQTFQENTLSTSWQGCKEFLTVHEEQVKLPKELHLHYIYQIFVEKKRASFLKEGNLENQFDEYIIYQRKLALELFFSETECNFFSGYQKDINIENVNLLKIGFMKKNCDDMSDSDHKALADYFVADTLMKELQLGNQNAGFQKLLIERIFSELKFQLIRLFLDCSLCKLIQSLSPNIFQQYQSLTEENEKSKYDLIYILAREGTTEILQLIFHGVDFKNIHANNEKINIENIPIENNFNTLNGIQYLLKQGGVNIVDQKGKTPLHHAAETGHTEMVKFLVTHGANVNIKDIEGETPLHSAAWEDRYQVIRQFIDLGVNVDIRDSSGESALITAAWRGRLHIIEFLIKLGADINVISDDDNTALIYAASRGHLDIVEYLEELGADIHAKDSCGDTSLHLAASRGHLDTVKFLAEHGARIDTGDNDEKTPLHLAAISGELDIAEYLVQLGVDVNARDNNGETPLHFAAREGNLNVVKFFVELGVDFHVTNAKGFTPSQLANSEDQSDIVKFFENLTV